MKLNSFGLAPGGYEPPKLPLGFHGPDILADAIIHGRQFSRTIGHGEESGWLAPLTDDAVKKVINLVYHASLLPEEGRFPRFKLVCEDARGSVFLVSRVQPVLLETVDSLRRLSPACTNADCALLIAERDGSLVCEGIVNIGSIYATYPGRPGVYAGSPPRLRIDVFGPAHIRVGESGPSFELRAGKVRSLCPYEIREATDHLWGAVDKRIKDDAITVIGAQYTQVASDPRPFLLVLSRMLRRAVDARHGGAFIFLPVPPHDGNDFGLRILYPTTDLDLGDDLVKQWLAYGDVANMHGKPEYDQAIRMAEARRAKMLTDCDAVANFSAVDGCVVLTHCLRVLGFGAKIDVSPSESQKGQRRFKHIASNTVYEDLEFMRLIGGTRHQSVARLCQAHSGVVVYTVSQDGELKLFYSDEEFAYVYGLLDLPTTDSELYVM